MLAPGARCPDCILARQRERQQPQLEEQRTAPGPATNSAAAHEEGRAKSPEQAAARDHAVTTLLKAGPASFDALMASLPDAGLSPAARESACRSTLLRLKTKGMIKIAPEGYALV